MTIDDRTDRDRAQRDYDHLVARIDCDLDAATRARHAGRHADAQRHMDHAAALETELFDLADRYGLA